MSHRESALTPWIASFTDSFSAAGAATLNITGFGLSLASDVGLSTLGTETGRTYTATGDGSGTLAISLTVATLPDPVATVQVTVGNGGIVAQQSPLSVQHGAVFDPTTIASLVAWYDADDASTITKNASDLVSQWDDKSGNGKHAVQSTESAKPKYFASGGTIGQAHVRWGHDGTWHRLTAPSTTWRAYSGGGIRNTSIFFVFNMSGTGNSRHYKDLLRVGSDSISVHTSPNDAYGAAMYSRGGRQCTGGTATSALPSKVLGGWFHTDSGFVTRINGSVDDTDSTIPAGSGDHALNFGGNDSSHWTDFEISEILIFNTELTGTDLSDVESYLNTKWSIY